MLLQLSHFPPFIPLHPAHPLPPTFPPFSSSVGEWEEDREREGIENKKHKW